MNYFMSAQNAFMWFVRQYENVQPFTCKKTK